MAQKDTAAQAPHRASTPSAASQLAAASPSTPPTPSPPTSGQDVDAVRDVAKPRQPLLSSAGSEMDEPCDDPCNSATEHVSFDFDEDVFEIQIQ